MVYDENQQALGMFKQKMFSFGGKFEVLNNQGEKLCTLKGKVLKRQFKFLGKQGEELAIVDQKWAGLGKELFTTADNYALTIAEQVPQNDPIRIMILAAVVCIDMVMKE